MPANLFQNLLKNNMVDINKRQKQSMHWFRDNITRLSSRSNGTGIVEKESAEIIRSWTNLGIGMMYFVHYNPKHKDTLKYYDGFPLIIPIEKYTDGILGLNLHYLPPILRAKLMDALYETLTNKMYDEKTKFKLSYQILKSLPNNKYFKPCIKRYLGNHFTSQFVKIHPSAWESALFMPVEDFRKQTKEVVWSNSRKMTK